MTALCIKAKKGMSQSGYLVVEAANNSLHNVISVPDEPRVQRHMLYSLGVQ